MSTLTRAGVRGHRQTVGWRSCQGKWADKIHGLRGKKAFEGHLAAEPRAPWEEPGVGPAGGGGRPAVSLSFLLPGHSCPFGKSLGECRLPFLWIQICDALRLM